MADPTALGLAGFALTTFALSVHNAGWAPDVVWIGLALFYGGMAQFTAGMWDEILLFIGYFGAGTAWITLSGYLGVITALVAWYTSAAVVVNSMGPSRVLPVGSAIWATAPRPGPAGRPVHAG